MSFLRLRPPSRAVVTAPTATGAAASEGVTVGRATRFAELDALRGVAALTVVFSHVDQEWHVVPARLNDSPLHFFYAGSQAVILFFVLSGFVLALPFYRGSVDYWRFEVRRVCRICIPWIAALALGALLVWSVNSNRGLTTEWVRVQWAVPLTTSLLVRHASLVWSFNTDAIDGPVWSLVHEMRVSLFFPLLMIPLRRSWLLAVIAALTASAAGAFLDHTHPIGNWFDTLVFLPAFAVGAAMAGRVEFVRAVFRRFHALWWLLAGVLLYTWAFWAPGPHTNPIDIWMATGGAAIFIVAALESPSVRSVLRVRPIVALGRISYSLYLIHVLVFLTAIHLFFGRVPLPLLLAAAVVVSIVLAHGFYLLVERPAMRLGRALTRTARAGEAAPAAPGMATPP